MDNNFRDFRLKLIFLALCILLLLAIKGHIRLGYAPEQEKKSIAVAFDYYGSFEKDVEVLVSRLEEAYMEVRGIKDIYSVSEPGRGYVLCQFSDQTRIDEAYVQISDITAYVYADFPAGVNRPVITRSSSDSYPVYIAWFSYEKAGDADRIREAYEAVSGVGEVELGGRKKKELMVEFHTGRLAGMALPGEALGSMLRSSNLACKVAMPGGQTLVLSSRLSSASDFGQVQVSPELKLSDIARLEYKDAESQSMGHIDGQPVLLFFVMKSGEGNTVRLCRHLDAVTSHFGGSQFFSLGNKIEKSFIVTSLMLLLLFIFLLLNLWFKTNKFHLVSQDACRSILSLLAAIAAVATAGFQVDMTVMAALFFVVFFSRENSSKLFKTAIDLSQDFADIASGQITEQDVENHINSLIGQAIDTATEPLQIQITKDNKIHVIRSNVKLEKGKKKRHNAALTKIEKIINNAEETNTAPTDLSHNTKKKTLRHKQNVLEYVYFGSPIRIGNDLYTVELTTERADGQNPNILDLYNMRVKKNDLTGTNLIASPQGQLNNTTSDEIVNHYTDLLPIAIILSTFIITLYVPVHFRNLILPFCIALSSGLFASAVCRYFIKEGLTPRIRIPLWCYTPILFFVLFLISNSPFSPFASDVSFSMEYESGTSFSFIEKSALDVEAALLKWNAFDHLTLHVDQGRASFTILGGRKREIMAKISELSSFYPEVFFYIPEKHTSHAVDVTVYGNDVIEIENNILQLAKYVNKSADNVNIIYNFKSDVTNIVLEIPVKCASAGLYPYDVYKTLYYTASEPVVDKYFEGDVETDVKIRGDARYRKTLSGLLSVPVLSPFGIAGEAGDYITVHKESAQGRICHKNRMRSMSLSVTGISRSKLGRIVSDFPFTGSCHGEVVQ